MPYKSKAQQGKLHAMLQEGKISKKVVDKFDKESKNLKNLPKKVKKK